MDERIVDVDGNEIIISVDGIDDMEIADIKRSGEWVAMKCDF